MATTPVSLIGVKNGVAMLVAIMLEPFGKFAVNGAATKL